MNLFLDRDGVLNVRTPGDYVKRPAEFIYENGVRESLALLAPLFHRIVVITNQSGIGRGVMTEADLGAVHRHMLDGIEDAGGRIDGIYFCPHRPDAGCNCRKPAPGMVLQAQSDFPDINLQESWLVGDSVCDMELAISLGMRSVLINGKTEEADRLATMPVDHRFDTLAGFVCHFLQTC